MPSYRTLRVFAVVSSAFVLLCTFGCEDSSKSVDDAHSAQGGNGPAMTTTGSGGMTALTTQTTQSGGATDSAGATGTGGNTESGGSATMDGSTTSGGVATSGGTTATGGTTSMGGTTTAIALPRADANVKFTEAAQVIDGFGVSNAWQTQPASAIRAAVYDALFSLTKGAGLSILRNRIPFRERPGMDDKFISKDSNGEYVFTTAADGAKTFSLNWSTWDLNATSGVISAILAKGADYDVTQFMSTPWTPPNNSVSKWKLPSSGTTLDYVNTPDVAGYLDPNHYADYADVLADYALGYRAKMGVDLDVLSLQNEPNWKCTYESADWSAAQFHDFIAILKTEFTKKGVFTKLPNLKIMMPEFANVNEALAVPTLSDSNTAEVVGLVGVHQYEFGPQNVNSYSPPVLTTALAANKRIWMTEYNTSAWPVSGDIADGLILARLIHLDFTVAGMSAFNYWWAWGTGNGYLVQVNGSTVTVPKRTSALGQFSRFIRPGWRRVGTTLSPGNNVSLSAYKNAAGTQIAVVAINAGSSTVSLPLTIDVGQFGLLTHYRTSATEDLANVGTITAGATVNTTLDALSVNTFVGAVTP